MHNQSLHACLLVIIKKAIGIVHHQVRFTGQSCALVHRFADDGAEGDVRHERAVHHVEVHPVCAARRCGCDLFSKPAKVGGVNRRGEFHKPDFK